MPTKLLNSKFNESGFFDGSPILMKLKDTLCERDSNLFQSSQMNVSTVLVKNSELIQLVVSCDGISSTLDIIIPEIKVIKTNDEILMSLEMFSNSIEQDKLKKISVDKPQIILADKSTSCHLITTQVSNLNNQSLASDEVLVTCPNCDDCPWLKDDESMLKVILNESEVLLNHKESELSIPFSYKPADVNKRKTFLEITSCLSVRDNKIVLHWNVESYKGVIGYRIFIDGLLKSTVHSPRRTCTLISGIDLKTDHLISICIIPDPYCIVPKNIADTLEQFYFQPIKLN